MLNMDMKLETSVFNDSNVDLLAVEQTMYLVYKYVRRWRYYMVCRRIIQQGENAQ